MSETKPARTRIAPSPTGDPHVGTAYMALFNRALADKTGGQFIFRLDDTDQARRVEASEEALYEALAWLGIKIDESPDIGGPYAPYRQSERLDIYWEYVKKLIDKGAAYYCFATSDELDTMRKIQQKEGRPTVYDRRWRDRDPAEVKAKLDAGESYVVRMAMPIDGDVTFQDLRRGPIRVPASELDDKVIWKSDGFPTYHLANVVDDHEFKITHIIRGEEWLPSVPLHVAMYQAFGFDTPVMIHMPLLRNTDKSKVSKRKNPTSVLWFRDAGVLPEGLLNFLGNMGYSLPDDQEVFSFEEFVEHFNLDKIKLGGPIFDLKKMEWLNGEHMRALSDDDVEKRLVTYIKGIAGRDFSAQEALLKDNADIVWEDDPAFNKSPHNLKMLVQVLRRCQEIAAHGESWLEHGDMIRKLIPMLKTRMHTLSEAADYLPPFFEELPALPKDEMSGIKKVTTEQQVQIIRDAAEIVREKFDAGHEALEAAFREYAEGKELKVGPVFMTLRLAALRAKISPPLFESMEVLGAELTVKRLEDAASQLA